MKQETLLRVLTGLRKKSGLEHPERFGAYVNAVCNNVLMEAYRSGKRIQPLGEEQERVRDIRFDLDARLVNRDNQRMVGEILSKLSDLGPGPVARGIPGAVGQKRDLRPFSRRREPPARHAASREGAVPESVREVIFNTPIERYWSCGNDKLPAVRIK